MTKKSYSNINMISTLLKEKFIRGLRENLVSIIVAGSFPNSDFYAGWSDIDIIIVCNKINFQTKVRISEIKNDLEKKLDIELGLNIVAKREVINHTKLAKCLPGKVLQALYEIMVFSDRILYTEKNIDFYKPTKEIVRKYCLENIIFFLNRSRKELISEHLSDKNISKVCLKEIRASFTISKLACQYMLLRPISGKNAIIRNMQEVFPLVNLNTIKFNQTLASHWSHKKPFDHYLIILKENEKYIENFSCYFLTHFVLK